MKFSQGVSAVQRWVIRKTLMGLVGVCSALCGLPVFARSSVACALEATGVGEHPAGQESHSSEGEQAVLYGEADRVDGVSSLDEGIDVPTPGSFGAPTVFEGNAQIRRGSVMLRADRLTLDPHSSISGERSVQILHPLVTLFGERFFHDFLAGNGWMNSVQYTFSSMNSFMQPVGQPEVAATGGKRLAGQTSDGRGVARRVEWKANQLSALYDVHFTTCPASDALWTLGAETVQVDLKKREALLHWPAFYFYGIKIFSVPEFSLPTDSFRRSGFLSPSFYNNPRTGSVLTVPYYWSMAPNYDFQIAPGVGEKQGVQLGGVFRYLAPRFSGDVDFNIAPHPPSQEQVRYFYQSGAHFSDWLGWYGGWDFQGVSDDNYFRDFSQFLLDSTKRIVPKHVFASRSLGGSWSTKIEIQQWKVLLDDSLRLYNEEPHLQLTHALRDRWGFDSDITLDLTQFRAWGRPSVWRWVVTPKIVYPMRIKGVLIEPALSWHFAYYHERFPDVGQGSFVQDFGRSIPTFSLRSQATFEYDWQGGAFTQTLEPWVAYVYTPYVNQSDVPVLDTEWADWNFARAMSGDIFTGEDRVADANQVTAGVISRFLETQSGAQRWRIGVAQRFYFSPMRVVLPGFFPEERWSDFLVAMSGELGAGMRLDAGARINIANTLERQPIPLNNFASEIFPEWNMAWHYESDAGRRLNAALLYRKNQLAQGAMSWRWPMADHWGVVGRLVTSFLNEGSVDGPRFLEKSLGLFYENCCLMGRAVLQQLETGLDRPFFSVILQLELKGIPGFSFGSLIKENRDPFFMGMGQQVF